MTDVQHKRGTRAALDALAGSNELLAGQIYLITDENRLAVALTASTYETYVKGSTMVTVGTAAPTSPAVGDVWVDTN